jgi:cytochrome c-type biogenesis protein CcmH/NrfF
MTKSEFVKAIKKQKEYQERAAKKLKLKLACPKYKADQVKKSIAQRERQAAKRQDNLKKPLTATQIAKKQASVEKQRERVRISKVKAMEKKKLVSFNQPSIPNQTPNNEGILSGQRLRKSARRGQSITNDQTTTKAVPGLKEVKTLSKATKKPKSKERSVTKAEKELHNRMGQLGCIVCRNKGLGLVDTDTTNINYISIHHVFGRTKPNCHIKCLPLCQYHHDFPLSPELQQLYPMVFPIHAKGKVGGKSLWEQENGTQKALIKQVWALINFFPELDDFVQSAEQIELVSILENSDDICY